MSLIIYLLIFHRNRRLTSPNSLPPERRYGANLPEGTTALMPQGWPKIIPATYLWSAVSEIPISVLEG